RRGALLGKLGADDFVRVLVGVLAKRFLGAEMRRPVDDARPALLRDLLDARAVGRHVDAVNLAHGPGALHRPRDERLTKYRFEVLAGRASGAFTTDQDGDDHVGYDGWC